MIMRHVQNVVGNYHRTGTFYAIAQNVVSGKFKTKINKVDTLNIQAPINDNNGRQEIDDFFYGYDD